MLTYIFIGTEHTAILRIIVLLFVVFEIEVPLILLSAVIMNRIVRQNVSECFHTTFHMDDIGRQTKEFLMVQSSLTRFKLLEQLAFASHITKYIRTVFRMVPRPVSFSNRNKGIKPEKPVKSRNKPPTAKVVMR
jgi:hypothetical protein